MRLKFIYTGDFRKNERTLYLEAVKEAKGISLTNGDCVLLVSRSGKLLRFVSRPRENAVTENGDKAEVLATRLYRITGFGAWNPWMLGEYAAELGLVLADQKRFKEYYAEELERAADRRAAAKKKAA